MRFASPADWSGLHVYANSQPNGELPDSFQTMLKQTDLTPDALICPSSSETDGKGLLTPGHVSYVYLGKGLTSAASSTTVLAYEPLSHHGDGMNVLYGDCHIEWLTRAEALVMLKLLRASATIPATAQASAATGP
jgi:prepilin-type processing-associated H-X9-DG protein